MRDSFASKSSSSALRDAQVGLLLVAVLLGVFVYAAYYRITGQGRPVPDHVRMAPIATPVWPNGPPETPSYEVPNSQVPAARVASAIKPVQTTFGVRPKSPEPIRTDHKVAPVEFQQAAPAVRSKPVSNHIGKREAVLEKIGLKPGDKIDASKVRKRYRGGDQFAFGPLSSIGAKPPKIVVRPPKSGNEKPRVDSFVRDPQPKAKEYAPVVHLKTAPTKPSSTPPKQQEPALKQVQPALENSFTPKKPEHGTQSLPTVDRDVNVLRSGPEGSSPKLTSPKPLLTPKVQKVENSFQPVANAFQPVAYALEKPSVKPLSKQQDFAPQQDISKTARLVSSPAPKQALLDKSAVAIRSAPSKPAAEKNGDTYLTKDGDSFWSLATEHYGDGQFFHALYEQNRGAVQDFDNLPSGTKIDIPDQDSLRRRWPELCPARPPATESIDRQDVADHDATLTERLYTTREGDTLFEIAAKKLGQASRYVDIMARNDQRLPADVDHSAPLKAGLRLVLPD